MPANQHIPRVALRREEAAAAIGVSVDYFRDHVQAEIRLIRRGRLILVPLRELEKWVERNAAVTLRE